MELESNPLETKIWEVIKLLLLNIFLKVMYFLRRFNEVGKYYSFVDNKIYLLSLNLIINSFR